MQPKCPLPSVKDSCPVHYSDRAVIQPHESRHHPVRLSCQYYDNTPYGGTIAWATGRHLPSWTGFVRRVTIEQLPRNGSLRMLARSPRRAWAIEPCSGGRSALASLPFPQKDNDRPPPTLELSRKSRGQGSAPRLILITDHPARCSLSGRIATETYGCLLLQRRRCTGVVQRVRSAVSEASIPEQRAWEAILAEAPTSNAVFH